MESFGATTLLHVLRSNDLYLLQAYKHRHEMAKQQTLYSECLRAKELTYFFDLCQVENGPFYLNLTQTKKQADTFVRQRIHIPAQQISSFVDAFERLLERQKEAR